MSAQREQRPAAEQSSRLQAVAAARTDAKKSSLSSRPVRTEAASTAAAVTAGQSAVANDAAAATTTAAGAAESPSGANKVTVAFGRTTKLPPSQPQRQAKSAPLHRVRAGSAENLNVSHDCIIWFKYMWMFDITV